MYIYIYIICKRSHGLQTRKAMRPFCRLCKARARVNARRGRRALGGRARRRRRRRMQMIRMSSFSYLCAVSPSAKACANTGVLAAAALRSR